MAYFRGIVVFVLMINIIYEFIPNDSYKKYLKHISGIILILIMIKPIGKYCDENNLENKINSYFLENDIIDVNEFMAGTNEEALNKSALLYQDKMENEIKKYLKECNFDVTDVEVEICITNENEININCIKIDLKFINYDTENEYIKEIINEKFYVDKDIIVVV